MANMELNAVVTRKLVLSPELFVIRVAPKGWELPDFVPGQFAVIGLPDTSPRVEISDPEVGEPSGKMIRRAYSIASSPLVRDHLEFYVSMVAEGVLTPRLFALDIGDSLWLGPKITGHFTLESVPEDQNVILVGTGTGVAPYISMVRTHLPWKKGRKMAILHGARQSWDLAYLEEMTSMQRVYDDLIYLPQISRHQNEHVPWPGLTGHVQNLWTNGALKAAWGEQPSPNNTHVFLCGNPAMCNDMKTLLEADGFVEHSRKSPGQIHVELYW
ncbi:MAG: ferredoxin--NADP reductase [Candidatus Latescibacteria bacterium]|nr:ferredoxin--NADP reductase [Candidatus Latescibacterota bacterium]MBT4141511.1 ferredoxin--NADP reductase [Candidatus Latescibacterota bacterium]MBT5831882.1 ferredoxin--NADP reductase [Candidatus Latescibacterota bacterium]